MGSLRDIFRRERAAKRAQIEQIKGRLRDQMNQTSKLSGENKVLSDRVAFLEREKKVLQKQLKEKESMA